jgi:hypothetical protein
LATTLAPAIVRAEQPFLLLKLDGAYLKWGKPELGTGAKVRYAFINQPMNFPGARNCSAMRPLGPALERFSVAGPQLRAEAAAAFAMWESVADISFEPVDDIREANILIGAMVLPRGRAFANVTYDTGERSETRQIDQALICLNANERWKVGFGGDAAAYDLRYTIAHEVGHAIGLNHPGPSGQLMGFRYAEQFRAPQSGDMAGAIALYGSRDGAVPTNLARHRSDQNPDMGLR